MTWKLRKGEQPLLCVTRHRFEPKHNPIKFHPERLLSHAMYKNCLRMDGRTGSTMP